ncbi:hypothetical protein CTAYLR_008114 [Chrysophaeum taylorii]|uniref:3-isopropylmalate dehydratase n=1 Tax=Chrysophaeum taylorii TaxID=2483200 RepID=A0AAD7UKQ6_9STRA|nr:hypothetical protein CTAYLR_008114 [Chrysophaeum taylorii]
MVATSEAAEKPRTLLDKVWDDHVVAMRDEKTAVLYVDRHLVHEVTSPQAFEGLRLARRPVRRPDCTLCTVDHNVPTSSRAAFHGGEVSVEAFLEDVASRTQVLALEENVEMFGLRYFGMKDARQGIVHVVGPEQGFTLPGTTCVCGDSHTATHGAFGALAFGIGTSEVEHVLATQTILQQKPKNMLVEVNGELRPGVTSKDLVLFVIGKIGAAGGTGCAIEFSGTAIEKLSMEARMSISNMAIEAGARAGLIPPDETTFEYLEGRPMCPTGEMWAQACEYWRSLKSDEGAAYDAVVKIAASDIPPMVTWGTSPQDVAPVDGTAPEIPAPTPDNRSMVAAMKRAYAYMGLEPGTRLTDVPVDYVFIGSCTNGRIEDIRDVAAVAAGRKVADGVRAMIVPGSGLVKLEAEREGLDKVLVDAGFEWREPGCSMCLAMNPDKLKPGERCASTSNRNFEGRQGNGGRTHLMSPASAAATAIAGKLADVRDYLNDDGSIVAESSRTRVSVVPFATRLSPPDDALPPLGSKVVNRDPLAGLGGEADDCNPELEDCSSVSITALTGLAAPLDIANVDTDMIIPKEYLKTIKRTGLGFAAFAELRYENPDAVARGETPVLKTDFVLNREPWYLRASILVGGENFGCGSSREHAPWAIKDAGIRVVVAPSFADIFYNNCFKNGMLPIALPRPDVDVLMEEAGRARDIAIDLPNQTVTVVATGQVFEFEIDPFRKKCLLEGLDDIALTLQYADEIDDFEARRSQHWPWLDGAALVAAPDLPVLEASRALA